MLVFKFLLRYSFGNALATFKLLLLSLVLTYLAYVLIGDSESRIVLAAFFLLYTMATIQLSDIFIWRAIRQHVNLVNQLFNKEQLWLGIAIYSSCLSVTLYTIIALLLTFFGLDIKLSSQTFILLAVVSLTVNMVIQFCNTVFLFIDQNTGVWPYILAVPLCIPIYLIAISSWNLKIRPLDKLGFIESSQDVWLIGILLVYTALFYVLFERIWKN